MTTFLLINYLVIFSFLPLKKSIFYFVIIVLTGFFIFLTGRAAGKILDTAVKLVVIAAGSSNLYKNHGGSSDSSGDDDKDKDKDKNKEQTKEDKKK